MREIELMHASYPERPKCRVCGEPATHLLDVSTLSATIAPDPYEGRCEAHRNSREYGHPARGRVVDPSNTSDKRD